jgi:hypothetical protein
VDTHSLGAGSWSHKNPAIVQLKILNRLASLIGISFPCFYQKLTDKSAKPIGLYFPEDVTVYLVSDCHGSTPSLGCLIVCSGENLCAFYNRFHAEGDRSSTSWFTVM